MSTQLPTLARIAGESRFSLVRMTPPILLAVPNVSEGRDARRARASSRDARRAATADVGCADGASGCSTCTATRDHHRSVFTLAARQRALADALLRLARVAVDSIDVVARARGDAEQAGAHPHVGAIDVVPLVYLDSAARGAACAEALVVADRIAERARRARVRSTASSPATGPAHARRAPARRRRRARRARTGRAARCTVTRCAPTSARPRCTRAPAPRSSPRASRSSPSTCSCRRPPSVADARRVAALVREGGEHGLPGAARDRRRARRRRRAGLHERRATARAVARATSSPRSRRHAPVASAELVGLAPRAALDGFPHELPMPGFDPARHVIESALGIDAPSEPDPIQIGRSDGSSARLLRRTH